jgi:WD40 repeat protein
MSAIECVGEPDLRAFLLGQLPERPAQAVAGHLDACPQCEAAARRLDRQTDPLIRALRRARRPAAGADATMSVPDGVGPTVPEAGAAPPTLPRRIAGYEVIAELGRGGMSVVYQARQTHPGRLVALKMILAGAHAGVDRLARFLSEADAIARLQHPNIVQIYEVGQHEGLPFLSLEYVSGGSLAQKLAGGPQPPRPAAALVEKLARAVHHAHAHGVVHRDLKPANILLTADGTPKVSDFGLAKQERPELTATGAILGTPSYMAPEQASGDNPAVGPPADVYALGAILYELLTGRPPFQAPTVLETLAQVKRQEPVPPSQLQAQLPHDLSTICLKCLRKEPRQRYADARELAEDLGRFLAGRPIRARAVGVAERCWRWCRRNPALAGMTAAVTGLLLVVAVGASLLSLELSGALGRTRLAEQETQRKLLDSLVAQARAVHRGRRSGQRFETLKLLDKAAALARGLDLFEEKRAELRNVAIAALAMPDLYPVQTWDGFPPGSVYVDFDERLEIYARTDDRGNCSVRRVNGDAEIALLPRPDSCEGEAYPVLSRDGRFLAIRYGYDKIHVWQLDGARPRPVLEQEKVHCTDFHPNRPQVAFGHLDGRITLWDLTTGRPATPPLRPNGVVRNPIIALHPTEPLVAVTGYTHNKLVQIRDLRSGDVVKSLELPKSGWWVAWHPAGHTLAASVADDGTIHLFDQATFRCQRTFGVQGGAPIMCYNRAGDRLAVSDWSGGIGLYEAATGRQLFVPYPAAHIPLLRFHRGGHRLAGFTQERRLGVWQVGEGREYRTLRFPQGVILHDVTAPVSPDGRLVAAAMAGGVAFWDLDGGTEAVFLPLKNAATFVDFEPGAGGALLLGDESGLYRWPLRQDPQVPGRRRIGPPQALGFPAGGFFGRSADGRVLATAFRAVNWYEPWAGGWVRHADRPDRPLILDAGKDIRGIAVSPDGRWIVTLERADGPVKLWDVNTDRPKRTLRERGGEVHFSPDGRWLAVGGPEGCLLAVGSWEERRKLSGWWGRFSPDSRIMVVKSGSGRELRLIETDTGRELARLEDPNLDEPWSVNFTPDGSRLLVSTKQGIHVWDLRRIRAELARRDLDWVALPYPPAPAPSAPFTVELDLGDFHRLRPQRLAENFDRGVLAADHIAVRWFLRGRFHHEAGRFAEALRDWREAVAKQPDRALFCNDLARLYVVGPEPLRDARAAVPLAEKAVKLQQGAWGYVNTLGIAYYRASRYADAVAALRKSLAGGTGAADAANLYFLGLCHHRLGDATRAGDFFERAKAWHARYADRLTQEEADELRGFRAEAEAALARPPRR